MITLREIERDQERKLTTFQVFSTEGLPSELLSWVWLRWSDRSGGLGDGPPCETRLVNTPVLLCQVVLPVRGPVAVRAHCS